MIGSWIVVLVVCVVVVKAVIPFGVSRHAEKTQRAILRAAKRRLGKPRRAAQIHDGIYGSQDGRRGGR